MKLDFFEARFDLAIKRLRLNAPERVWREANRGVSRDDEELPGLRRRASTPSPRTDYYPVHLV
jgi:hypothetical protein